MSGQAAPRFRYELWLETGRHLTRGELAEALRDVANSWEASGEDAAPAAGDGPVFGLFGITGQYAARFGDDDRAGPNVGDMVTVLFAGGSEVGGTVTAVTGSHVVLDHGLDYNLALANRWEVSPGPYGYGATPEHIARVDAEVARQREQAARRRAQRPAKTDRNPPTPHKSGETHA